MIPNLTDNQLILAVCILFAGATVLERLINALAVVKATQRLRR